MSRIFKITEEQYKQALAEGIEITADLAKTNGNIEQAVRNADEDANKSGLSKDAYKVTIPGEQLANEGRIITKKDLFESRLKELKRHSKLYTVKDFIKAIN